MDKDFCRRLEQLSAVTRPQWVSRTTQELILRSWTGHVPFAESGLEEAIIRQTANLDFYGAIHPRRRVGCSASEYIDHLAHLICFLLRRARESRREAYRRLAAHAFPAAQTIDSATTRVVTFNYDDLFDRHLLGRFTPERVYFDRIKRSRDQSHHRQERHPHPLVVKLHGSINWRCPTAELRQIIDGVSREANDPSHWLDPVWYAPKGQAAPDDDDSPCIIPPLPNKPITAISLFSFLWTKAYEYLHEAEEIVFCGYSLPATDATALALFSNFANKKLERVTVVDRDPRILQKWRDLLNRRNVGRARWEYHSDFVEYVDSLS